jgi:acyl-coenzyme A synthetase/AMP-(fatty) acid ligase
MVPKTIEYLDELPKMPNGKVDYQTLRRREGL